MFNNFKSGEGKCPGKGTTFVLSIRAPSMVVKTGAVYLLRELRKSSYIVTRYNFVFDLLYLGKVNQMGNDRCSYCPGQFSRAIFEESLRVGS